MDPKLITLSDAFAKGLTNAFIESLNEKIVEQVTSAVLQELQQTDFKQLVKSYVAEFVKPVMRDQIIQQLKSQMADAANNFPAGSIPGTCINLKNFKIGGDNVVGGVHQSFQSTGIQDSATECQVTILDHATVFENKLVATGLEIKGPAVIDGDIIIKGQTTADTPFFKQLVEYTSHEVKTALSPEFFAGYRDEMFDKIEQEGLHLKELTINGKEIVVKDTLGSFITESSLRTVGELRQLQVAGEALIFNTLYVGNKRVGIGTMEPTSALSVWDEEIEVSIGKRKAETAIIQAPRNQTLILGSSNKDNILLTADGDVVIKKHLVLNNVSMTSGAKKPSNTARKGSIVFNDEPMIGEPVGWISLGGGRWSDFGKIN